MVGRDETSRIGSGVTPPGVDRPETRHSPHVMMNAMLEHFEGQGQAAAGAPGPEPSLSKPGTTWVSGRVRFLASPSLILRSREPPGDATFEPSRVRTFRSRGEPELI